MASDQPAASGRSELATRVISAAVLAPFALLALIYGGAPFTLVVAVVAALAIWEWTAMAAATHPPWLRSCILVLLLAGLTALSLRATDWAIALIAGPALILLVLGLRYRVPRWAGLGLAFVAIPCAGFIVLRQAEPNGWGAVLFVLLVVWATDIAAYFGGRAIGGPKIWPRVSPKKTWSGGLSGLAAAVIVGGLTVWLTQAGSVSIAMLLAVPLSIAAQAGDFLESAVKRRFGVKDSGHIIPGHGGILDRVDGLFGAAALAWLVAAIGLGGDVLTLPADIVAMSGPSS